MKENIKIAHVRAKLFNWKPIKCFIEWLSPARIKVKSIFFLCFSSKLHETRKCARSQQIQFNYISGKPLYRQTRSDHKIKFGVTDCIMLKFRWVKYQISSTSDRFSASCAHCETSLVLLEIIAQPQDYNDSIALHTPDSSLTASIASPLKVLSFTVVDFRFYDIARLMMKHSNFGHRNLITNRCYCLCMTSHKLI